LLLLLDSIAIPFMMV